MSMTYEKLARELVSGFAVPSDGDLRQEAAEWLANLNSASDEEIIVDLFNRWCQVRDRTREATLRRVMEMKPSEVVKEIRTAEEARK